MTSFCSLPCELLRQSNTNHTFVRAAPSRLGFIGRAPAPQARDSRPSAVVAGTLGASKLWLDLVEKAGRHHTIDKQFAARQNSTVQNFCDPLFTGRSLRAGRLTCGGRSDDKSKYS